MEQATREVTGGFITAGRPSSSFERSWKSGLGSLSYSVIRFNSQQQIQWT